MKIDEPVVDKKLLNGQQNKWEDSFAKRSDMFTAEPSEPAQKAAALFRKEGKERILELGSGQGRDTIFFAQSGFEIHALDYSESGLNAIRKKAEEGGLAERILTTRHDVRQKLPFDDASFDACYSHMLFCMALTTAELEFLCAEIRRVLKPGGLNIYTVRHTRDAHYGTGVHRGEDMYEVGGFVVHFFSREKVEHLAKGFHIVSIDQFEEGGLPRKLFRVTMRKKENQDE